ncbi:MAG TPA: hypothetical protein VE465_11125 [Streptosporangiaceae bacterium]|jgi:hypothetical protein|nr:hypothetical protein [Streptosporangiaceae bacterium]
MFIGLTNLGWGGALKRTQARRRRSFPSFPSWNAAERDRFDIERDVI